MMIAMISFIILMLMMGRILQWTIEDYMRRLCSFAWRVGVGCMWGWRWRCIWRTGIKMQSFLVAGRHVWPAPQSCLGSREQEQAESRAVTG